MTFTLIIFVHVKMTNCWFSTQELLQKAKDIYHNEGSKKDTDEYNIANKDVLKEKAENNYRKLSEEEK